MPTLTKPRKKEAPKKRGPKVQLAKARARSKSAEPKRTVKTRKVTATMDIDKAKSLAASQMRVELPELGLEHDTHAKNPTYRNAAGVRVSLRGHHADGTQNSPVIAYYLAVTGPAAKIKKYPQLRSGKFSWDNIKSKVKELIQLSSSTSKFQEMATRLEARVPQGIAAKFLPAANGKQVRVRFQFENDLEETQIAQLFDALKQATT